MCQISLIKLVAFWLEMAQMGVSIGVHHGVSGGSPGVSRGSILVHFKIDFEVQIDKNWVQEVFAIKL